MGKKTFLILGGYGTAGKLIAELLLQETDVQLIIAGRSLEKAQATANRLNQKFDGNRALAQHLDAADADGLKNAFSKIDFVVVSSSTLTYAENVTRAAMAAGIDYLDTQPSGLGKTEILESMRNDIKQAGRCFITEGGIIPGVPAALVQYAASYFDRLEIAQVCYISQYDWKSLSPSPVMWTELCQVFSNLQPLVFKDGVWKKGMIKKFDFGPVFGEQTCGPVFMGEMKELANTISSLKEMGLFHGKSTNWFIRSIFMPLNSVLLGITPKTAKPLGKLFIWGLRTFNKPPYHAIMMLKAKGWKDDKYLSLQVRISKEDGFFLTASSVVACLLQYLDGGIAPGLWYQANVLEPKRMMSDFERLGVKVEVQYDEIGKV